VTDLFLPALTASPTTAATSEATEADGNLTRKVKKRKRYEASAGAKERRAHQHHLASQQHLARSIAANSVQVVTQNSSALLPKSFNGASGSRSQVLRDEVALLRSNTAFRLAMLKSFRAIPYRWIHPILFYSSPN
jgi:hypothetical protein